MRLIDADAFIEYLGLDAENAREENLGEIVTLEDFDRQPTAYDINKVINQIKKARDKESVSAVPKIRICDAIEIVKAGDIE